MPPVKLPEVLVNEPLGKRLVLSEVDAIGATVAVFQPKVRQVRLRVVPVTVALTGEPAPFNTAARAFAISLEEAFTGLPVQNGFVLYP